MKKIAIVTSTRAEYGLLAPVIRQLRNYENDDCRIELIVTGTHLSSDYGNTVSEIETDGIRIDHRVKIPVVSATEADISASVADTTGIFTL